MSTSQNDTFKAKGQGEEADYVRRKDEELLKAIKQNQAQENTASNPTEGTSAANHMNKDFEGGFGGQEDLRDPYATTSGEH